MALLRLAGIVLVALAAGASPASSSTSAISNVGVVNFAYSPTPVTISGGDTVRFTWMSGGVSHSTTSGTCSGTCTPDGLWDSGQFATPHVFDLMTAAGMPAGTYHYYCTIHTVGMQGDVVVNPPTAATFRSFGAVRRPGGILVSWKTATEVQTLGFAVFREGARGRIRAGELVLARGGTLGSSYAFLDRRAPAREVRYWLRIVHADGTHTWFRGPLVT